LLYAADAGEHNMLEQLNANQGTDGTAATGVPDEGAVNYIQLTAHADGSFSVKSSRNGFRKGYSPKR
jgi:hypothetical protein